VGSFSLVKAAREREIMMGMMRTASVTFYIVALIAAVVIIDVLFFRQRPWLWERLIVNIGIVLVFLAFYLRFLKGP
jgi:hypothetical protein